MTTKQNKHRSPAYGWMLIVLFSAWICIAFPSDADQIVLDKGDILHGRILKQDDQSITMKHPALGEITIKRDRVIMIREGAISTQRPLSPVTMPSESFRQIQTRPSDGESPFTMYNPRATQPATQPTTQPTAEMQAEADQIVKDALKDAEQRGRSGNEVIDWLDEWHYEFGISLRGERNENIIYALKTDFTAKWKNDEFRVIIDADYEIGWKRKEFTDSSGRKYEKLVRDIDRGFIRGEFDWFVDESPWILFARSKFTYDYFKDWRHRVEFSLGPGYKLLDEDKWRVELRAGVNYLQNLKGENNRPQSEGLGEIRLIYKPTNYITLSMVNSFYPSFNTFGESRNQTNFQVKVKLGEFIGDGVYANFKIVNDYVSHPEDDDVHNDLRFRAGLSVEF